MEELRNLDSEVTPDVCTAYGDALHEEAAKVDLGYTDGWEEVERQLPNMKWFASAHCDLDAALEFVETRFRDFCGRHQDRASDIADRPILTFLDMLGALRRCIDSRTARRPRSLGIHQWKLLWPRPHQIGREGRAPRTRRPAPAASPDSEQ